MSLWAAEAVLGVLGVCVLALAYFAPRGMAEASTVALGLAAGLFNIVAAGFFVAGLGQFREELRKAYILVCAALALFALSQMQLPIAAMTDWWFIVKSGLFGLPFMASVVCLFLGMRRFAGLVDLHTPWASVRIAVAVATLGAVVAAAVPLVAPGATTDSWDISAGLIAWATLFQLFAAVLVVRITHALSDIYSQAMSQLNSGTATLALGGFAFVLIQLFVPETTWFREYGLEAALPTLASMLLVVAGVSFALIGETRTPSRMALHATSLNIITYTAMLAANPNAIDDILDGARTISASMAPGAVPTEQAQRQLANVYLQLERYLISDEELQDFTKESLRRRITQALRLDANNHSTFWPLIQNR